MPDVSPIRVSMEGRPAGTGGASPLPILEMEGFRDVDEALADAGFRAEARKLLGVRTGKGADDCKPAAAAVRGRCRDCGAELASLMVHQHGRGYLVRWICWGALAEEPRCSFYVVP